MATTERSTTSHVRWELDFHVNRGETWTRFMDGLRERTIRATRCGGCGWVFVPPQAYCERCFERTNHWLDLPAVGQLESYTIVHLAPGGPQTPFALGLIRLDGADGLLTHYVRGEADRAPDELAIGQRVGAVWRDQREGSLLDIQHFESVADGG
jgi:uncharacterized OB-fold protein